MIEIGSWSRSIAIAVLGIATIAVVGCKQDPTPSIPDAVTIVRDADGMVVGTATFQRALAGVKVHFEGSDLPPGIHGIHIHERGECEPPDFKSAGEHFNPGNASHGLENPDGPHAGDLPNLEVQPNGRATLEFVLEDVTVEPSGAWSLLAGEGTALIIHADADDQVTDPSGDSGDRIACGVIRSH